MAATVGDMYTVTPAIAEGSEGFPSFFLVFTFAFFIFHFITLCIIFHFCFLILKFSFFFNFSVFFHVSIFSLFSRYFSQKKTEEEIRTRPSTIARTGPFFFRVRGNPSLRLLRGSRSWQHV